MNWQCKNEECYEFPTNHDYCLECYQRKKIICIALKRCIICDGPLQPIGSSRKNGRNHDDWTSRLMHKKCKYKI